MRICGFLKWHWSLFAYVGVLAAQAGSDSYFVNPKKDRDNSTQKWLTLSAFIELGRDPQSGLRQLVFNP